MAHGMYSFIIVHNYQVTIVGFCGRECIELMNVSCDDNDIIAATHKAKVLGDYWWGD